MMTARPIAKVLIANRGEIAVRIMRTARARGLKTVAVYSDADESAFHVRCANEAVHIGCAPPAASYLNVEAVIEAAVRTGADAIHPGYGFLSERADFAEACEKAGLVFIGPPAAAIAAMGDKAEAKRRMIAAGVPTVPGYQGEDQSESRFAREAAVIGFPVMVKASAGGGGRGMRLVERAEGLPGALASARNEAESAFGDGRMLLERAVSGARHIEVQVMADAHGGVIHLGERDCSLQRRRQKVIEEAPSPVMTPALRAAMGAASVEAARAAGYRGAGTVEFLFDPQTEDFYFLEMNTRLQVEHPVTELVTGLDLVALQFDIAEGKPLPVAQDAVTFTGWAMEARLYAEDPAQGFLPQTGRIAALEFPAGEGVRIDAGVEAGDLISAHYDPMIAKVIAYGETRDAARERLAGALEETTLLGLATNARFLVSLIRDAGFAAGEADTTYIEDNIDLLAAADPPLSALETALAAAAFLDAPIGGQLTGWNSRGPAPFPLKLQLGDDIHDGRASICGREMTASIGDETASVEVLDSNAAAGIVRYVVEGRTETAHFRRDGAVLDLQVSDRPARRLLDVTYAPAGEGGVGADAVAASMAGTVTSILVKAGDRVAKGDIVATIEAMKMEHRLIAPRDGEILEVCAAPGDQVAIRAPIIKLTVVS